MNSNIISDNFTISRELIIQVNDTGIITLISQNCYDILGFTQNELINTYIDVLLGYNFNSLLSHTNIQASILKKDGQKLFFDILSKPAINGNTEIVGLHLSLINISKYIYIEEQYKQLIKIFETAKDIVYKFQILPEFKFVYISPSVKDMIGYDAEANYLNPNFPFELVHPDDTGIGLSLVKSIVELHGGNISVESEYGKGSKFIVILPVREVIKQHTLFNRDIKNKTERIQIEFSDVYL